MKNQEYIVVAFGKNQLDVLNRITSIYLKRNISIERLNVTKSFVKGVSMFVISVKTTADIIIKIVNQINNIIDVMDVEYYLHDDFIRNESIINLKIHKSWQK